MHIRENINNILNDEKFEKFILSLILINIVFYILDSMAVLHAKYFQLFNGFELFSIVIFTIEFLMRIICVKNIKKLTSPMLIIDFLAIFPYYLSFCNVNTTFLRIFRLSRIFRILKINRYSVALQNVIDGFKSKKEELIITSSIFIIGILFFSILIYLSENTAQPLIFSSIPKSFYFTIMTMTSVGYGEIVPITAIGQAISSIIAIFGIALHGLFVGVIGTALINAFKK